MAKYDSYPLSHPGHPNNRGTWQYRIWVSVCAANNIVIPRYRDAEDPVHPLKDKLSIAKVRDLPHEACPGCRVPLTPGIASLGYKLHPAHGGDNHISNVLWLCHNCLTPPSKFKIVYDHYGDEMVMPSNDFRRAYRKGLVVWDDILCKWTVA